MTLSNEQMRAARGLLNWSADRLAEAAKLGVATIRRAETRGTDAVDPLTVERIIRAFEEAGVELLSPTGRTGAGVRWAVRGSGSADNPSECLAAQRPD